MEDRETARMRKYGESKTTRIMMATVPNVISGLGLRKLQADGFLLTRVYVQRVKLCTDNAAPCPAAPPKLSVTCTNCTDSLLNVLSIKELLSRLFQR